MKNESELHPIGRVRSGPRTATGKQRSRGNALRHGLCATDIFLPDEHPEDFNNLLLSLRERWQPQDALEDALVFKMATTIWRGYRIPRAETAAVARVIGFHPYDRMQHQCLAAQEKNHESGLAGDPANCFSLLCAIDLLSSLGALFETRGYDAADDGETLRKIYGNKTDFGFPAAYIAIAPRTSDVDKNAEPSATRENLKSELSETINAEIARLRELMKDAETIESKRNDLEARAALIPSQETVDRIIRYEAHLDHRLERTIKLLVALQRERLASTSREGSES